jgi:hypothetical protein
MTHDLGEGKGKEIRIVGERATASSDVSSKRTGSSRVATDLTENINLSLPQHMHLYAGFLPLFQ